MTNSTVLDAALQALQHWGIPVPLWISEHPTLALCALLSAVLTVLFLLWWLTRSARVDFSYKTPLTEHEQAFFHRLRPVAEQYQLIVLAQVAFSQFLRVSSLSSKARQQAWGRWRQKVADFVLCDQQFNIVVVMELDDSSHRGKEDADRLRDSTLAAAGIPTLRWPQIPSTTDLERALVKVLTR